MAIGDGEGHLAADFEFPRSLEGWKTFADKPAPGPHLGVAIETRQGAAVDPLLQRDHTVFPVHPVTAHSYRQRKAPNGTQPRLSVDERMEMFVTVCQIKSTSGALTDQRRKRPEKLRMKARIQFTNESKLKSQSTQRLHTVGGFVAFAVAGIALVLGAAGVVLGVTGMALGTATHDPLAPLGAVLAGGCLIVGVLTLGSSLAFFRSQPSARRPGLEAPPGAYLFAGIALLFGSFMGFVTVGGLLEGLFVDTLPALGKLPDPEISPWACMLAVLTLGPSLAFFRFQHNSRRTTVWQPDPVGRAIGSVLTTLFCVAMLFVAAVGIAAAFLPELLPHVKPLPALGMSASALVLVILLLAPICARKEPPQTVTDSPYADETE